MSSAIAFTGPEALAIIAEAPDAKAKSPDDLREAAAELEGTAGRKGRLETLRVNGGNRRTARQNKAARDAEKLRFHAEVIRLAANEVEERQALTVGEALRWPFVRFLRRKIRRAR